MTFRTWCVAQESSQPIRPSTTISRLRRREPKIGPFMSWAITGGTFPACESRWSRFFRTIRWRKISKSDPTFPISVSSLISLNARKIDGRDKKAQESILLAIDDVTEGEERGETCPVVASSEDAIVAIRSASRSDRVTHMSIQNQAREYGTTRRMAPNKQRI